ncbi:MAG: hypothetical protein NWF00_12220 [Candidatus Bathyarchaeota archaeon]|nr:hypothetical protein [Candidatus Bathyarchaeota archaeon]
MSVKQLLTFKKAVGILVIAALAVAITVLAAPSLVSFFEGSSDESECTTLNLALFQSVNYSHGDTQYVFSYRSAVAGQQNLFYLTSGDQTRSFLALTGATYTDLGLEIKVSVANEGLIVLMVKPSAA